jgi:restriction system protein
MAKRSRSRTTDNPSVLFYFFLFGLLGYYIYTERHWFITHLPLLAAAAGLILLVVIAWFLRRRRLASTLAEIDEMNGHEFERYLGRLFRKMGFRIRNVGASGGDFGADLILCKEGIRIAVQAKNYCHGKVGNDAVQQAIAGATYYDCHQAMVVTNSRYTKAAKEQAEGCAAFPVTLWDRRDLSKILKEVR